MDFENDYILRLIKTMVRALASVWKIDPYG